MIVVKKSLSRRTVLRGMGVTLALPLLDAMVPALSALTKTAASPVRRFSAVYVPNGITMEDWTPAAEGTAFELTPILKPLEPVRDRLLVISGLNGPPGQDHYGASTGFLTGMEDGGRARRGEPRRGLRAGVSVDQLAAQELGRHTELASLELAVDGMEETTGSAYTSTISWRSPTQPLPMENNPRRVFERLFGDSGTTDPKARAALRRRERSILDSVTEAAGSLQREVGPGDRVKIREYLEAVRDTERRIQNADAQGARELPLVARPAGIPPTFEEHASLLFDLQLLAYQSDLTRVITFMLGRELTGRTYPELGVLEAHHPLSHHSYDPAKIAGITRINTFHLSLFAKHLKKLQSTPDGDGSLLDHMLVLYGSGMSDGNSHDLNNVPLVLAGGAASDRGRHVRYAGEPTANLLVAIMHKLDLPVESVGRSTDRLDIDPLPGV